MSTISVYIDNRQFCEVPAQCAVQHIYDTVYAELGLPSSDFYLHQHGRIADPAGDLSDGSDVHVALRLRGGKGGFGSMLRAIGAQIEKTTNREACRDLSGRRLRDINEEKRLKSWLDGQPDRDQEAVERRKQKLAKAQAQPKHVFEDKEYEQSRQDMTQNVADSVEEGMKKAAEAAARAKVEIEATEAGGSGVKRKASAGSTAANKSKKKKKKSALWLGGDFSSDSDSDDTDTESSNEQSKVAVVSKATPTTEQSTIAAASL